MTEPDSYYFTVTTSNSAGESPVASARKFVGPDTPKAPSFAATVTGNSVKLQWNSPSSSGVNGGNVDYSNAVYRIVRYPDEKVIAEAETGRTITDELPSPEVRTDYYYTLTATVNGLSAQPVKSPVISMGPILPPFNGTFTSQASLAGWTILDVNDDNTRWSFYSSDRDHPAICIARIRRLGDNTGGETTRRHLLPLLHNRQDIQLCRRDLRSEMGHLTHSRGNDQHRHSTRYA